MNISRPQHKDHYLIPWTNKDPDAHPSDEVRAKIGSTLPITRFVRMLLSLLESGQAKPHLKYLPELFRFLHDFAKLGEEETRFLLKVNAISTLVEFYLKIIKQSNDSGVRQHFLALSRFAGFVLKFFLSCTLIPAEC